MEILQEMSIILFHLESRIYNYEILIKGMIRIVCENFLCGASSPNMVTGCLRKIFKWVINPDSASEQATQMEQIPSIRRQLV